MRCESTQFLMVMLTWSLFVPSEWQSVAIRSFLLNTHRDIGVGDQSTLGEEERHFFPKTKCLNFTRFFPKNYQNARIFMIFVGKSTKFPNFTRFLPEKCPNFA